jgi:sec-independent protein translocase protein TatC
MSEDPNPAATVAQEVASLEEGKELTILEHLQELRRRLIVTAVAIVLGILVSLALTHYWLLEWLIAPARDSVEDVRIIFTEPLGYWMSYFRVALVAGIAIAMPVMVYETLAFIGPALTRQEKRWVYPIAIGASLAFVGGGAFAYYVIWPPAMGFLLNSGAGVEPYINIKSYLDLLTRTILAAGLVFEMPLLVMGLAKLRIVSSGKLIRWWRYAIVLAFVAAAIVTPSIDPITQSLVAGPIIVLYFAGIGLAKLVEAPASTENS